MEKAEDDALVERKNNPEPVLIRISSSVLSVGSDVSSVVEDNTCSICQSEAGQQSKIVWKS